VFSYWISLLLVLALPSGIFAATGKSDTSQGREGSNARAWFDKGYRFAAGGDYDAAIMMYTKAIEQDETMGQAYLHRGSAYSRKGLLGNAIRDYNKAIALDPGSAAAYKNRGLAYCNSGEYGRAIEDYTKALSLKSNDASLYYNRGTAYGKEGKNDRAIMDFNKAIAIDPGNAEAYAGRGNAYYQLRLFENAGDDFQKACTMGIDTACRNLKAMSRSNNFFVPGSGRFRKCVRSLPLSPLPQFAGDKFNNRRVLLDAPVLDGHWFSESKIYAFICVNFAVIL
jgi:tetratricopeptide (TPR) repeat protein